MIYKIANATIYLSNRKKWHDAILFKFQEVARIEEIEPGDVIQAITLFSRIVIGVNSVEIAGSIAKVEGSVIWHGLRKLPDNMEIENDKTL